MAKSSSSGICTESSGRIIIEHMDRFLEHCNLAMSSDTPDMGYYSSLALCAFDVVFSIRARFESVVSPLIDRLCRMVEIPRQLENPYVLPSLEQQIKVSDFVQRLHCESPEELANRLNNHQRTSATSGILKTEAFLLYLEVFSILSVETYQDAFTDGHPRRWLEEMLRTIPGQNVSVDYFFMLAGNENDVKVDVWIRRFVKEAVGRDDLTPLQIKELFRDATEYYRNNGYPDMTVRHLDHIIWNWQKAQHQ